MTILHSLRIALEIMLIARDISKAYHKKKGRYIPVGKLRLESAKKLEELAKEK